MFGYERIGGAGVVVEIVAVTVDEDGVEDRGRVSPNDYTSEHLATIAQLESLIDGAIAKTVAETNKNYRNEDDPQTD